MARHVSLRWGGQPGGPDFAVDRATDEQRRELIDLPWTWLNQIHGSDVVVVEEPGHQAGASADAAVTTTLGAALAVHVADCAPVVLFDIEAGVVGVAHAGWRGLLAGVLENTVGAMHDLGATMITANVEAHIRARCYEFGADDLDRVADRYGDEVRSTTSWGTPALDVAEGVRVALESMEVLVNDTGGCTACEPRRYFSHRARGDVGRHALVIALEET